MSEAEKLKEISRQLFNEGVQIKSQNGELKNRIAQLEADLAAAKAGQCCEICWNPNCEGTHESSTIAHVESLRQRNKELGCLLEAAREEIEGLRSNQELADQLCAAAAKLPDEDTLYEENKRLRGEIESRTTEAKFHADRGNELQREVDRLKNEVANLTNNLASDAKLRDELRIKDAEIERLTKINITLTESEQMEAQENMRLKAELSVTEGYNGIAHDLLKYEKENDRLREALRRLQYTKQSGDFTDGIMIACRGCGSQIIVHDQTSDEKPECKSYCWLAALLEEGK